MFDMNHLFFINSSSKYTLIYSNNVLVKIISCFTTDVVDLSPVPHWSRASTSLTNKQFLYVRRVWFLGKEDQYISWLNLFYAWIKSLYLVNILLMTIFCPNLHVFLSYLECSFWSVRSTFHFLQLLYNLSLLIWNMWNNKWFGEDLFPLKPLGVIVFLIHV